MQTLHSENMSKADEKRTGLEEQITILRKELNQARNDLKLESVGKQTLTETNDSLHKEFQTYQQQCQKHLHELYQRFAETTDQQKKQHMQQRQDLQLQKQRLQQELETTQAQLTSVRTTLTDYNTALDLERNQKSIYQKMYEESVEQVKTLTREKNNLDRAVMETNLALKQRQRQLDEQAARVAEAEVPLTFA